MVCRLMWKPSCWQHFLISRTELTGNLHIGWHIWRQSYFKVMEKLQKMSTRLSQPGSGHLGAVGLGLALCRYVSRHKLVLGRGPLLWETLSDWKGIRGGLGCPGVSHGHCRKSLSGSSWEHVEDEDSQEVQPWQHWRVHPGKKILSWTRTLIWDRHSKTKCMQAKRRKLEAKINHRFLTARISPSLGTLPLLRLYTSFSMWEPTSSDFKPVSWLLGPSCLSGLGKWKEETISRRKFISLMLDMYFKREQATF